MTKPFFSIIIPTLNEEKYLPHLLEDLSSQTFRDFEVIIVDGKSDDHTQMKAKLYKSKLRALTILTSPKRHVCTQRNFGAKDSSADVLIFIDADVRLPTYYLQGLKYRWESEKVDILSTWFRPDITNAANDSFTLANNLFFEIQSNIKPSFLMESLFVISKECFTAINGFDESINYSEGSSIIKPAIALGFEYRVVRDPLFIFSFRRLRKFGILKTLGHVATIELSELLGPEFKSTQAKKLYPMPGGKLFSKHTQAQHKFQKNIAKLLKEIKFRA